MGIEVRRAAERFVTRADGITTYHSFSYGAHYDPGNVAFGPLVAVNDERLPGGTGYDDHRHGATEIVTWVLEGALAHRDSLGNEAIHPAGTIACSATGSGIVHAERAATEEGVRFLQMMLRPEHVDAEPARAVTAMRREPGLHPVVGGAGLPIGVPGATLWVGRLGEGPAALPAAPLAHVLVLDGSVALAQTTLGPDDTARVVGEDHLDATVERPAVLAVWTFR